MVEEWVDSGRVNLSENTVKASDLMENRGIVVCFRLFAELKLVNNSDLRE